jgi:hypothetical protein
MSKLIPESDPHETPKEDREFYIELGMSTALAFAIVLLV